MPVVTGREDVSSYASSVANQTPTTTTKPVYPGTYEQYQALPYSVKQTYTAPPYSTPTPISPSPLIGREDTSAYASSVANQQMAEPVAEPLPASVVAEAMAIPSSPLTGREDTSEYASNVANMGQTEPATPAEQARLDAAVQTIINTPAPTPEPSAIDTILNDILSLGGLPPGLNPSEVVARETTTRTIAQEQNITLESARSIVAQQELNTALTKTAVAAGLISGVAAPVAATFGAGISLGLSQGIKTVQGGGLLTSEEALQAAGGGATFSVVGGALMGAAGKAFPALAQPTLGGAVSRVIVTTGLGAGIGTGISGVQALAQSGDILEGAKAGAILGAEVGFAFGVATEVAGYAWRAQVKPRLATKVQTGIDTSYQKAAENLELWRPTIAEKVGMKITGVTAPTEPAPGIQSLPNIQSGQFETQKISQLEIGKLTGQQLLETRTSLVEITTPESISNIPKMLSGLDYDEWLSPNSMLYGRTLEPVAPTITPKVPVKPILPTYIFTQSVKPTYENPLQGLDKGLESEGAVSKPYEKILDVGSFSKTPNTLGFDSNLGFEKPSMAYDNLAQQTVMTGRVITEAPTIPRLATTPLTAPKIVALTQLPIITAIPVGLTNLFASTKSKAITLTTPQQTQQTTQSQKQVQNPFTQPIQNPFNVPRRETQYEEETYLSVPTTSPLPSPQTPSTTQITTQENIIGNLNLPRMMPFFPQPPPILLPIQDLFNIPNQTPTPTSRQDPFAIPIQTPSVKPIQTLNLLPITTPITTPIFDVAQVPSIGQTQVQDIAQTLLQSQEFTTPNFLGTGKTFKGFNLPSSFAPTDWPRKSRKGIGQGHGKYLWEFPVVEPSKIMKTDYMPRKRKR